MDQNEIDAEEISNERLEDLAAEEEEEEEEDDESDDDENSSNDDSGVEYDESDDEDDDGSEEDILTLEEMKKLMLTFCKGNYDGEIESALGENPPRTATHPGGFDLYNKPADWMERNAIGLENVKLQLQERTRYGEGRDGTRLPLHFNLEFSHNVQHAIEGGEPIVWHDPSIDQYWEQLTAALSCIPMNAPTLYRHGIHIENIEMQKETVATLVRGLCDGRAINSIKFVRFTNINLCREGVVLLSTLVERISSLQTLDLTRNRIDDMNSVLCLSRALKAHQGIYHLEMRHCDLGNDPEILSVILQSDVRNIFLEYNNIGSLGAVKISEYLEGNPPAVHVHLDNNDFDDDDAILFSQALKKNTNLEGLFLRQNNFTSVGVKTLFSSLYDSTSLNAISESNHTCAVLVFDDLALPIQKLLYSLNDVFNSTSKILIALHDKESLLEYLADVPVELMPEVLAFIQRESDQIQSISMMYAAMRWWNMPSLYSYYCCVSSNTKRKRDD